MELKHASQYTIFHPSDVSTLDGMDKFILVSDNDEWNANFRNGDGLTGIQHDGAPRVYASMQEADEAAHAIMEIGNKHLIGIYQCGYPGRLIHNFNPPLKDTVEGYADAGSW